MTCNVQAMNEAIQKRIDTLKQQYLELRDSYHGTTDGAVIQGQFIQEIDVLMQLRDLGYNATDLSPIGFSVQEMIEERRDILNRIAAASRP